VLRVRFSPSDLGPKIGVLNFLTDNARSPGASRVLRGTGGGP